MPCLIKLNNLIMDDKIWNWVYSKDVICPVCYYIMSMDKVCISVM